MRLKDSPPIVKIVFMTLVTVFVWIAFDVYRALTIQPSLKVSEEVLKELDPSLDETALNQLQNRVYVPEEQINNTTIVPKNNANSNIQLLEEFVPELNIEQTEIASEAAQTI